MSTSSTSKEEAAEAKQGKIPYTPWAETTFLSQRLCSELLPSTPLGQHYLELRYTHMNRLVRLLWYDETMV